MPRPFFRAVILLSSPLTDPAMIGNPSVRLSRVIRQYRLRKLLGSCKSGMGRGLRPSAVSSPNSHFLLYVCITNNRMDADGHIRCDRSSKLEYQQAVGLKP